MERMNQEERMDSKQMMNTLDRLLEEAKVAILANIDESGNPSMRWMSPGLVRGQEGLLYAVTSPKFKKTSQLEKNPSVQWMVQTRDLSEIVSIRGTMQVLDNPSLRSTVMEAIGTKLATFWKINENDTDVVILETVIDEMEYFSASKGIRESITINREDSE
jgi:general stress protein 26